MGVEKERSWDNRNAIFLSVYAGHQLAVPCGLASEKTQNDFGKQDKFLSHS